MRSVNQLLALMNCLFPTQKNTGGYGPASLLFPPLDGKIQFDTTPHVQSPGSVCAWEKREAGGILLFQLDLI